MVEATREIGGKIEQETRFYMTSLASLAARALTAGPMIRGQGAGETGPHAVMDLVFRDGECRIRAEPAPANLTALHHMPPAPPRRAPGKDSLRLRRKTAACDGGSRASRRAA